MSVHYRPVTRIASTRSVHGDAMQEPGPPDGASIRGAGCAEVSHGIDATSDARSKPRNALRYGGWALIVVAIWGLGVLAESSGMPSAHIVIAMVVGCAIALVSRKRLTLPAPVNSYASSLVGVVMGGYIAADTGAGVTGTGALVLCVTITGVLVSLMLGYVVYRVTGLDLATSVLGMIAGGSSASIAASEDAGATKATVAFMQYSRVLLVAFTVPVLAWCVSGSSSKAVADSRSWLRLVERGDQLAGVCIVAMLCIVGAWLARQIRLPSPNLFGPMILTIIVSFSKISHGFIPAGILPQVVLILVGLDAGLGLHRQAMRSMKSYWRATVIATIALCAFVAVLSYGIAAMTDMEFVDAYLATTPGGINAVVGGANSIGGDLGLISAVQAGRLVFVAILIPVILLILPQIASRSSTDVLGERRR